MKPEGASLPPHVVHNQTAAMLEIGTNLLTHTAEQTRKLSVVEAKVRPEPGAGPAASPPNSASLGRC